MSGSRTVRTIMPLLSLVCLAAGTVCAAEEGLPPRHAAPFDHLRIGADYWLSRGQGEWEIVFGSLDPVLGPVTGRSRLEWEDLRSDLLVLNAEIAPTRWLRISGAYGSGDLDDGRNTDTDWVSAPLFYAYDYKFSESKADVGGEVELWHADLHIVLSSWLDPHKFPAEISVFGGYHSYRDELEMRNGLQTVLNETSVALPFPGVFNSTYDFDWEGLRLGARGIFPLSTRLSLQATGAMMTRVEFRGEGFWNLREDYRPVAPNFVQEADGGSAYDVSLAVTYRPRRHVGLKAGYTWSHWSARDGTDTVYLRDGTTLGTELESVESTRVGYFVGVFAAI